MSRKRGVKRDRSYFITRSLISRVMLATKPEPPPSPTAKQLEDGRWAVLAPDGAAMAVLGTNRDAWAWIDRQSPQAGRDVDRPRRIKASATFS